MARELFEQGRALMAKKEFAKACAKLAESQRLDPAPGTLLNLAVCHESEGKTATAWSEFNDALTLARRDGRNDRVEFATKHIQKLEARLSRLTVVVPDAARVDGLEVTLDGVGVKRPAWGTPVPVDPGAHVVEATAPGYAPFRKELSLGDDRAELEVTIPGLRPVEAAAPTKPVPPTGARDTGVASSGSGQRTAGYIVGGVGLVALGVGGFFGLRAFSRWDERNAHCSDAGCDPTGVEAGDDASRAAMLANVGIGVGLAGLAVGSYLVLSAGPSSSSAAMAGPTRDGRGALLRYQRTF